MELLKIRIADHDAASVPCARCGKINRLTELSSFVELNEIYQVRCACQYLTDVCFEERLFYRRTTYIRGTYFTSQETGYVVIRDISLRGLRFETDEPHHLERSDVLVVEFMGQETDNTLIRRRAEVRNVQGKVVSVEFEGSRRGG